MILLNQQPISQRVFPNGEIGITQSGHSVYQSVSLKWESDADLIHLKFLVDSIRRQGGSIDKLIIEYMPYSRLDRVRGDWAFTLQSVAEFINALDFPLVVVIEPHSDVTCALLKNSVPRYVTWPTGFVAATMEFQREWDRNRDYVVFPDAGAEKRYQGVINETYKNTLIGQKHRDYETGKITSFGMWPECVLSTPLTPKSLRGPYKAIILDDLCSFGGTFLATAKVLEEEYDVDEIVLVVAHLEHNVHAGDLLASPLITKVLATDTIYRPDLDGVPPHPKIHIYDWRTPSEQSQREALL